MNPEDESQSWDTVAGFETRNKNHRPPATELILSWILSLSSCEWPWGTKSCDQGQRCHEESFAFKKQEIQKLINLEGDIVGNLFNFDPKEIFAVERPDITLPIIFGTWLVGGLLLPSFWWVTNLLAHLLLEL